MSDKQTALCLLLSSSRPVSDSLRIDIDVLSALKRSDAQSPFRSSTLAACATADRKLAVAV